MDELNLLIHLNFKIATFKIRKSNLIFNILYI